MAVIDDVRSIIAQSLKIPVERLTPDTRLEDLGAQSLDVIEIVFGLEEKFDISIPFKANEGTRLTMTDESGGDQEFEFTTVGDVAEVVQKLVDAKASR